MSTATIRNIEHPTSRQPTRRSTFLTALAHGYHVDRQWGDVLAWLFDGTLVTRSESARLWPGETKTSTATESEVHQALLKVLQRMVEDWQGAPPPEVTVTFGENEIGTTSEKELLKMEEISGERLLVKATPSVLTVPEEVFGNPRFLQANRLQLTPGQLLERRQLFERRHQLFNEQIRTFGARAVHSTAVLSTYLRSEYRGDLAVRLTLPERRTHIERLIRYLTTTPYQIILVPKTPDMEMDIKSTERVVIRAMPFTMVPGLRCSWGPKMVWWKDRASVLNFFVAFERNWNVLLGQDGKAGVISEKAAVTQWFRDLLAGKICSPEVGE